MLPLLSQASLQLVVGKTQPSQPGIANTPEKLMHASLKSSARVKEEEEEEAERESREDEAREEEERQGVATVKLREKSLSSTGILKKG